MDERLGSSNVTSFEGVWGKHVSNVFKSHWVKLIHNKYN